MLDMNTAGQSHGDMMEVLNFYGNQDEMTLDLESDGSGLFIRKRYNGLKNQGATCYLNCILQCLYMTQDFREQLKQASQNSAEESTDLLLEIQKLFKTIKEADGSTEGITRSLCINDVYKQQDVIEYYHKILKGIGFPLSEVFRVKISNKASCPENHRSDDRCDSFTIPLSIEGQDHDVFNVVKGLQNFFKHEKLDEDNWLYCKDCGRKAETETWYEMEEFPTILTLYLKRFYFDYNVMRTVKNHCSVNIPLKLSTSKWYTELPNVEYELYAVINHFGEESGGHYNADIKSFEDEEWYCFDDSSVTKGLRFRIQSHVNESLVAYVLMYKKVEEPQLDRKSTQELKIHRQENCNLFTQLLEWIRFFTAVFENTEFPTSYKEVETLCCQVLRFCLQLPEIKANITHMAAEQANATFGYNLSDMEKEWLQLHALKLNSVELLRTEFGRVFSFYMNMVKQNVMYNLPLTQQQLDEANLNYIKDLLTWVNRKQSFIDNSEWDRDQPTIESHLGSHQRLHESICHFKSNIDHAQADKKLLSHVNEHKYSEYLANLTVQYRKLLNSFEIQMKNMTEFHNFAVPANEVLTWLSEKIEEEMKYDWSDYNDNITAKRYNVSGLKKDVQLRMEIVKNILAAGEKLWINGHPARRTIKDLNSTLYSQLNLLQEFCSGIETHLKVNTDYFKFFQDVKEGKKKMKNIEETMKKKYIFDRSSSVTHLEHLLQDAVDEKEQLLMFKKYLDTLNIKSQTIVQLKPRNPACSIKRNLLIHAVCDFKQGEVTICRGDKCVLLNNSNFKWTVKTSNGSKATVPSICFIIPSPNKEALESSSELDASWKKLMIVWQKLHVGMNTVHSWHCLMKEIQCINSWNNMTREHHKTLENMKQHFQNFMNNSQNSEIFDAEDRRKAESAYINARQHYSNLLHLMEQGAHNISKNCGLPDVPRKDKYQQDNYKVPANENELESKETQLKKLCSKVRLDKPVDVQDAKMINKLASDELPSNDEHDHIEEVLKNVYHVEVDQLGMKRKAFKKKYDTLFQWIADAKQRQEKMQFFYDAPIEHRAQGEKLLEEIENIEDKVKDCVSKGTDYRNSVKVHIHQLVTLKALNEYYKVKSPSDCGEQDVLSNLESDSDSINKEINTLKSCYHEVLVQARQHIKNIMVFQRHLEDKEQKEKITEDKRKFAESHSRTKEVEPEVSKQNRNFQEEKRDLRNVPDKEIEDRSQENQEFHNLNISEQENFTINLQQETNIKQNSVAEGEHQLRAGEGKTKIFEEDAGKAFTKNEPTLFQKITHYTEQHKQEAEEEEAKDTHEHQNQNTLLISEESVCTQTEKLSTNKSEVEEKIADVAIQGINKENTEGSSGDVEGFIDGRTDANSSYPLHKRCKVEKEPGQLLSHENYPVKNLKLTDNTNVISGNMSALNSRYPSFESTSTYSMSSNPSVRNPAVWTEEMSPIAGIIVTDTQEKLSVTEAMH